MPYKGRAPIPNAWRRPLQRRIGCSAETRVPAERQGACLRIVGVLDDLAEDVCLTVAVGEKALDLVDVPRRVPDEPVVRVLDVHVPS